MVARDMTVSFVFVDLQGRNWARLVKKLSTEGSTVNIVAFGGSVTVGYRLSNTSYPEEFVGWMSQTFPGVKFNLINLARRATAATFAALCLVQDMPEDAGEGSNKKQLHQPTS
jgi:hypothetical protein